jgi:hypothetical protein
VSLLGYYVNCDEALCVSCFQRTYVFERGGEGDSWDVAVAVWRAEGGFEDWDEPAALLSDEEQDTPTHCTECKELIPHALTSDGYTYVVDAVRAHIEEFVHELVAPNAHSVKVVHAWVEQYADWGEMNGILVALHNALYEAMDDAEYFDYRPTPGHGDHDNSYWPTPDSEEPYDHSRGKEDRRNAYMLAGEEEQ